VPSTDFEKEKAEFREYHGNNIKRMEEAKDSFISLLTALITRSEKIEVSKVEGRVKDREECIRKFNRKYRTELEKSRSEYTIKEYISDLIGLRVVCLYEDDIERVREIIDRHFNVIEVTDKIAAIESTESSFGYKGLHLDAKLGDSRSQSEEYQDYADLPVEIQIRTIVQDSWSILDHKIKYKKAIPNNLKRRINTLAALFELADREFKEIRVATLREIARAEEESTTHSPVQVSLPLDAFGLLRIATHFFKTFDFEAHKVDGFTAEIVTMKPDITRREFNAFLRDNLGRVRVYQAKFERENPDDRFNPYTLIRHCLYLQDRDVFRDALTNVARDRFDEFLRREG